MDEKKKYQILWMDDDFNPQRDSYKEMCQYKQYAQDTCPISITTCITGNEFIALANSEDYIWDAFIIDVNAPMSEDDTDTASKDIIYGVYKGISSIVEQQRILLFCFSGSPQVTGETPESSINGFLKDKGFSNNSKKKELYYYLKSDVKVLCVDINSALGSRDGSFKEHPEFKALYRIGNNDAKCFIDDLLKWEKDNSYLVDYVNLRFIIEAVVMELYKKGFFGNNYPALHTYIVQPHKDPNSGKYLNDVLNDKCRSKWEAASISFLSQYANVDHHLDKEVIRDSRFQRMIFDAFVIFSQWYVRFMGDFKKNGYDMNVFTTTPSITNDGLIGNMIQKNGFWMVKDRNGVEYRLQDKNDQKVSWTQNEKVTFSLRNQYNTFPVAANIIRGN